MDCFALINYHEDDKTDNLIDIFHQFSAQKSVRGKPAENEGVMMVVNEGSQNSFRVTAGEHLRLRGIVTQKMYYGPSYNTKYKSIKGMCLPTDNGSVLLEHLGITEVDKC